MFVFIAVCFELATTLIKTIIDSNACVAIDILKCLTRFTERSGRTIGHGHTTVLKEIRGQMAP